MTAPRANQPDPLSPAAASIPEGLAPDRFWWSQCAPEEYKAILQAYEPLPQESKAAVEQAYRTILDRLVSEQTAFREQVRREVGFLLAHHVDKLDEPVADLMNLSVPQWKRHNHDLRQLLVKLGLGQPPVRKGS